MSKLLFISVWIWTTVEIYTLKAGNDSSTKFAVNILYDIQANAIRS